MNTSGQRLRGTPAQFVLDVDLLFFFFQGFFLGGSMFS